MAHFHIEGVPPYDGDWPLETGAFTNAELHTIKKVSGVRSQEIEEALDAGDNDLVVALAQIALERAGHRVDLDLLWGAEVGKITLVAGDEEEEEKHDPPSQPPSGPGGSESGDARSGSSGDDSSSAGDRPASDQSLTGSPPSATGATSGPEISGT